MSMTTHCRRCHREFAPDAASINAGRWQTCPQCRQTPPARPQEPISKEPSPDE